VTVGGAVQQSAVVPITLTPLRLQEALAAAGGVAVADTQFVTIRLYRDGTLYQVPLSELPGSDIILAAGDSIFVDTDYQLEQAQAYFAEQIALIELRQTARNQGLAELQAEVDLRRGALDEARSNFQAQVDLDAVDRDYVYLVGEVSEQGRYPLPFGGTGNMIDALYDGGSGIGATSGNPAAIYLLRGNPDNTVTAYHLDASNAANIVVATGMELRPNDVIFVAQQPVTSFSRVVSQLTTALILATVNAATR